MFFVTCRLIFEVLFNVVAGCFPLAVFLLHERDRLDCALFITEAGVELHDDVISIGGTWKGRGALRFVELSRYQFAQRLASAI